MKHENELYDVTIIGGGPTGLYTAFYSSMRGLKTKVIEYLPQLGGKVSFFYPEKTIYDVPGFYKITGSNLIKQLKEQTESLEPTIVLGQQVQEIIKNSQGDYCLLTDNDEKHITKTVILTAGDGIFKMRKMPLEETVKIEGENFHYHLGKMENFTGKNVVVSGGGSGAINWAIMVAEFAKHVTLVHTSENFHAHPIDIERLHQSEVELKIPYSITDVIEDNGIIYEIVLKEEISGMEERLPLDEMIAHHGAKLELGPLQETNIHFEKSKIVVDSSMATNLEGIYAAGDIVTYPNKNRLISGGFSEGVIAVNSVTQYLDPSAPKQVYSTVIFGNKKK